MPYGFGNNWHVGILPLALMAWSGCTRTNQNGALLVHSRIEGSYEIYRASSEEQLQFVSEEIGSLNQRVEVEPGSYLILADCSSISVVVLPGKTIELYAHQLSFQPPGGTAENGQLSVQCDRVEKTRSRQNLTNRFELTVLEGDWDILVGMVPVHLSMPHREATDNHRTFSLSSLEVRPDTASVELVPFFVSPEDERVSITTPEAFSQRVFLLAGNYVVEVNGTQKSVTLAEGEELVIQPAYLRISTPPTVDLEQSSQVRGNPSYVEINDGNWLNLNETYPILPGTVGVKLNDSEEIHQVTVEAGQLFDMQVRSVRVNLNCSPWEWNCLGSKHVYLYKEDQPYPFASGVSDVPLLFYQDTVWVSVEGSRDLRYRVPNERSVELRTWKLQVQPEVSPSAQRMTDLLRIESIGLPFAGNSLDLSLEGESSFDLIRGSYYLSAYHRLAGADGIRQKARVTVSGTQGEQVDVSVPIYYSEKHYAELQARRDRQQKLEGRRTRRNVLAGPNHARRWATR